MADPTANAPERELERDPQALRTAAEQFLQFWRRAGMTHLPRPEQPLPGAILHWSQAAQAPVSQSLAPVASSTSTSLEGPAAASTAAPREALGGADSPTPDSHSGAWCTSQASDTVRERLLAELQQEVQACRLCAEVVCSRRQTVFGIGPKRPRLVMFGEAPGAEEDLRGEPFVGAAGQLLDKILTASGLHRDQVYIMNALKCRPPNNRTPTDSEIENCRPHFERQLEILQPEIIVCWGAVAVKAVLRRTESIGRLRGSFHTFRGAKVLATYHPAYLLRTPAAKKQTWEDMKLLMRELGIPIPPA